MRIWNVKVAYVVVKGNIKIKYPGSIANEFNNDFYINVGPKLANAIDNSKITGSFWSDKRLVDACAFKMPKWLIGENMQ